MPAPYLEMLGGPGQSYWYESGYCVRDALAQGLGADHPLVQDVDRCGPSPNLHQAIKPLLEHYGIDHWISVDGFQRTFPIGEPVVFLYVRHSWGESTEGHAVFLTDSRPLMADPDIIVAGYIVLTGGAES